MQLLESILAILVLSIPRFTTHIEVHLNPPGARGDPRTAGRVQGFEPGDTLITRLEDRRLVLEKRETIKRRHKARFACLPKATSLARALLAERREEATREAGP